MQCIVHTPLITSNSMTCSQCTDDDTGGTDIWPPSTGTYTVHRQQKRMYDAVFHFLDSIPTIPFAFSFVPLYLCLFPLVHALLQKTVSYSSLDYRKQSNILCNVAQLTILVPISFIGLNALWRGDISLIHTDKHKPNVQVGLTLDDVLSTLYL